MLITNYQTFRDRSPPFFKGGWGDLIEGDIVETANLEEPVTAKFSSWLFCIA